jgi:hypothetical protein
MPDLSLTQLARELGVPKRTLYLRLNRIPGLRFERRGRRSVFSPEEVARIRAAIRDAKAPNTRAAPVAAEIAFEAKPRDEIRPPPAMSKPSARELLRKRWHTVGAARPGRRPPLRGESETV